MDGLVERARPMLLDSSCGVLRVKHLSGWNVDHEGPVGLLLNHLEPVDLVVQIAISITHWLQLLL